MSFLAPLFLLGGLAVALPVIFHLIRRTSRVRTVFSSIMFLKPGPPRLTRRNRLEDLLLLALRCVVLGLLALAFARPFLKKPLDSTPPPAPGARVLALLDTSASMQRDGLWDLALEEVDSLTADLEPGDSLAIWTYDRATQEVLSFETWNSMTPGERRGRVRATLADLQPGWGATYLDQALVQAADALAEWPTDESGEDRRVVVISDLQEGSRLSAIQAHDWPPGVQVVLAPLAPRRTGNASLQAVADPDGKAQEARVTRVLVENAADSEPEQFELSWASADPEAAAGQKVDVYVPAGQSRLVLVPTPENPTGLDRLTLRGDEAPYDNAIFVMPPRPEQVRVVYLGSEPVEDPTGPAFFLRKAFRETARQNVQLVLHQPSDELPPQALEGVNVIIVTGAVGEDQAGTLRRLAQEGATLLLAPVDVEAAKSLERCLESEGLFVEEAALSGYAMLGELDFRHPWLAPFADARFSDFTKIHYWRYRRIDESRLDNGRVIARFDRGDPAVVEIPLGAGRALVMAAGWHPRDSQLALSSKFVPLLYSMLDLAGATSHTPTRFEVGDEFTWTDGVDDRLFGPDGQEIPRTPESAAVRAERPGIYRRLVGGDESPLAVNMAPAESRTRALAADDFEALGVPLALSSIPRESITALPERMQYVEMERRQRIWRWLLAAALAVVLLETWMAARALRRGSGKGPTPSSDQGTAGSPVQQST